MNLIRGRIFFACISFLFVNNALGLNYPTQSVVWDGDKSSSNDYSAENSSVLDHLKTLSSDQFSGRKFSSQGGFKSQTYLVSVLKALSIPAFKNQYRHTFTQSGIFQSKQGANIIGYIPGTHNVEDYIILTAHYDHLGTKRNKIFNGADDNASGTAALLDYAKRLKQQPLKHSVILLFTDGEEVNLLGAKAFLTEQEDMLQQFKLNINLDMIAGSRRTKKLRFISHDLEKILSPIKLKDLISLQADLKSNSTTKLTSGFRNVRGAGSSLSRTNWRMASDHGVFSRAGIPFLYFGVGPHNTYHTEFDDFNHINSQFFLAATDIIYQQLTFIDNAMYNSLIVKKE